jgi:hypothetical protein
MVAELKLILLLTDLLAITLTCQRFLHVEAPQGILKGFAFLYSNLCQEKYTSKQSQSGIVVRIRLFWAKLYKSLVIL